MISQLTKDPHLMKDSNEPTCGRCKLKLDNHTPSKCPLNAPSNKQQSSNPFLNTDNSNRNKINNHTKSSLQLSVSTNKPDHMAELLEATRKMTKYFKRSCKHSKPHPPDNSNWHVNTNDCSTCHPDKQKHKSCNNNDKINEVINSTCTSNSTPSEPKISKEHHDSDSSLWTLNDYHRKRRLLKLN